MIIIIIIIIFFLYILVILWGRIIMTLSMPEKFPETSIPGNHLIS